MVSETKGRRSEQEEAILNQINVVKSQVEKFAGSVQSVLKTQYSQAFLEVIYTPLIAQLIYFKDELSKLGSTGEVFRSFDQLYGAIIGDELKSLSLGALERDVEWKQGNFDFVTFSPMNKYEKLIYSIFGISYLEMRYIEPKQILPNTPRLDLRRRLKETIESEGYAFTKNIVNFIPYTLFEGLLDHIQIKYPTAKVHWLDQIHNDNYIFYLAYLKEQGTQIIGQPHGGAYSQVTPIFGNEIAEIMLSDQHHAPSWSEVDPGFPNLRASRNRFLNIKDIYRNIGQKRKSRYLVYLAVFFTKPETPENKSFVKDGMLTKFHRKKITELGQHFSVNFDFKIHPRQVEGVSEFEHFLRQLYPECGVITKGEARSISHNYEGVIFLDFWGSGIIELASTNIPLFVYLGPEISISQDYESFLWSTKISSTRDNLAKGTYVEVNKKKYRSAYGASYLYPFYFARLIRKLMA